MPVRDGWCWHLGSFGAGAGLCAMSVYLACPALDAGSQWLVSGWIALAVALCIRATIRRRWGR